MSIRPSDGSTLASPLASRMMPKKMRMTAIPLAKRIGSITGGEADSVVLRAVMPSPRCRSHASVVAQRSPPAGSRGHERQGVSCAIIRPLLEIALDLRHLVGDEGEADHRLVAGLGERIEASDLHLDRFQPVGSGRIKRGAGLPEWRIRGPGPTADRLDPGTLQLLGDGGKQIGRRRRHSGSVGDRRSWCPHRATHARPGSFRAASWRDRAGPRT